MFYFRPGRPFNPAAWLIKKHVAQSRELACDEVASETLRSRAAYAHSLLNIAQSISATSSPVGSHYALGLFDTNALEERIMNLLKKTDCLDKRQSRARVLFVVCLLGVACFVSSAFSIQVARRRHTGRAETICRDVGRQIQGQNVYHA